MKEPKDTFKNQPDRHYIEDWCPDELSRRRFLTLMSASAAMAMGASCSRIDRGAIVPYTKQPDGILPGVATWYASTFQEGWNTQGVLVKTREGRPIHIEGNPDHPVSKGTVSLRAMGDLLGLYDPDRLRAPSFKGASSSWEDAIAAMTQAFKNARSGNKPVLLVTGAVVSPSQAALIEDLKRTVPGLRHDCWEPVVPQAAPRLLYKDGTFIELGLVAGVNLALQSDFLGNDGNAPVSIRSYAERYRARNPSAPPIPLQMEPKNRLWVCEGSMTLTGANADERIRLRPSGIAPVAFALIRLLHEIKGRPLPDGLNPGDLEPFDPERIAGGLGIDPRKLKLLAEDLYHGWSAPLVLAGPMLPGEAHAACRLLNITLGGERRYIQRGNGIPVLYFPAQPGSDLGALLEEAAAGKFAAAVFWGANPAYAFPDAALWQKAVASIPETFRIGLYEDETAVDCNWRLPEHHWLESWGDFQSSSGYLSLRQPVIGPLFDTMQGEDILFACMQKMDQTVPGSYLEYLKSRWREKVYMAGNPVAFEDYWNAALHSGGAPCTAEPAARPELNTEYLKRALEAAASHIGGGNSDTMELVLSPGAGVYDGRYANNGWLNELPDPVTKATWGNPVSLSIADAERLGVSNGDVVEVSNGETTIDAPVLIQPGQCDGVASLALGYGRRTGSVAKGVGVNAYLLINMKSGSPLLVSGISIRRKSPPEKRAIPITQTHDRMEGRDLVRSIVLADYKKHSPDKEDALDEHHQASLIPNLEFPGHKWGMAVDLSSCVGCSACVIACQSENNSPVVGPERVLKGRHMHWIRIDRYYEGDPRSPRVLHQPMFCQQCDNAPCEIVCPVNATTHSPDGLNQMVYNRCVGTRYCSNNCPFKVRRFNFFEYNATKKDPEKLVFNPEVTVRPRGVMEKCTFCIQRIENAKEKARVEDRNIRDGDIVPACAAACPAQAIVFGDLNDPASRLAQLVQSDRSYRLLEELGIKPSVTYLADVSNPAAGEEEA